MADPRDPLVIKTRKVSQLNHAAREMNDGSYMTLFICGQ